MPFEGSEEGILAAEEQLRCRFPEPVRRRWLRENGGEVSVEGEPWRLFPVWDARDRKRMARTANHIVRENAAAREWRGFPESVVAVASDAYGKLLVMDPATKALAILDHETTDSVPVEVDLD